MEISIEDASKFLGKYYDIEKQCFRREAFSKQQLVYLLTDYNAIGLSARVSNEIAGFTIRRLDIVRSILFGHILTVGVVPSYRRKGIAERLLHKIEVLFKEKGAEECRLEVREDNEAALSLYQKLGYKKRANLKNTTVTLMAFTLEKPCDNLTAFSFTPKKRAKHTSKVST